MKSFKDRFLDQYQKVEPEKQYRQQLDAYERNGQNARLPYHNGIHVRGVLRVLVTMRKVGGMSSIGVAAKASELAAVFHDLGHNGGPDISRDHNGMDNIDRAIDGLMNDPIINRYPEDYIETAREMIESTRFPHAPYNYRQGLSKEVITHFEMLRDADCLWGLLPQFTRHVLWTLALENGGNVLTNEAEIDWDGRAKLQESFLTGYEPLSSVGRAFKNAFLKDALVANRAAADEIKQTIAKTQQERESAVALGRHLMGSLGHKLRT